MDLSDARSGAHQTGLDDNSRKMPISQRPF